MQKLFGQLLQVAGLALGGWGFKRGGNRGLGFEHQKQPTWREFRKVGHEAYALRGVVGIWPHGRKVQPLGDHVAVGVLGDHLSGPAP